MSPPKSILARALATLLASLTAPLAAQPRTTTLQLPPQHTLLATLVADVDGDGRADLALGARDAGKQPARRRLAVHLQRATGAPFVATPDRELDLPDNVVACAFADCDPAQPGAELVVITPTTIATLSWPAGEARALGACELLFQPGYDEQLIDAQSWVRDLDGDGLADLLLPESDGCRVGLQRRGEAGARLETTALRLPPTPEPTAKALRGRSDLRRRGGVTLRLSGGEAVAPLLTARASCPLPRAIDFDGDGRLDVVALDRPRLSVFAGSVFAGTPTQILDIADAEVTRLVEPGFYADLCDFDGDRKPELLLCRTEAAEGQGFTTSVELLAQPFTTAHARLRLQGLIAPPQFDDIDGDGQPDLCIGSLRTDSLSTNSIEKLDGAAGELEAQLTVFLTRNGKPKLPAALTWRTRVSPTTARGQRRVSASFLGDVDGDGVRDLVLQDADRSLQAHRATRRGDALQVTPLWQTKLPDGARLHVRMAHAPCDDVVIAGRSEVLHVRWR